MWTVKSITAKKDTSVPNVIQPITTVVFSSDTPGDTDITYPFKGTVTNTDLNRQIKVQLDFYNGIDAYVNSNPTYTPPTTPVVIPPSQDQIDFNNFSKWLALVQLLAAAKSMNWIDGTETMVLNVKAKVMALAVANLPKMFQ